MRKSDVTGSISTAKGEEMLKAQNFSALDNLRGKAAGVNIFSNSSQPGAYGSRVVTVVKRQLMPLLIRCMLWTA